MDMAGASARTALEFAGEISGFQVDFLNGSVSIREKRE
jgi:hypothetical protein